METYTLEVTVKDTRGNEVWAAVVSADKDKFFREGMATPGLKSVAEVLMHAAD